MIGKLSGKCTTQSMKKLQKSKPELSIVIVSYNTREILRDCLRSLAKVDGINFETIVSDNGSADGSVQMIKEFKWVRLVENKRNLGFARANNVARKIARGEYVLFLNSDTVVNKEALSQTVNYLKAHEDVGSVTCKLVLPNGELDRDTRRRFPTPMISFNKLFLGRSNNYWYMDVDENTTHEVDVIQGAFHLTRKKLLDQVGWFDEDYFLDGEDIDLCWRIKELGYKIVYYPKVSIVHVKKASKKAQKSSLAVTSGVRAMEIFYRKHIWSRYPFFVNYGVVLGLRILLLFRTVRFYLR